MGKMGKFDVSGFKKLQTAIKKALNEEQQKEFIENCAGEIANALLKRVINRTPVGDYSGNSYICNPSDTGRSHKGSKADRRGGTLRDSWHYGIKEWQGEKFVIEIINDAKNQEGEPYPSYVEYGHRTANGNGWVQGHFMMEVSRKEVEEITPKMLETLMKRRLMEVFKA